ncbi:MAG: hypothetical protein K2M55_03525 [Muribaculaceae bacterium]|nr:hypothetical protein [Muribaculaceae bacterium]
MPMKTAAKILIFAMMLVASVTASAQKVVRKSESTFSLDSIPRVIVDGDTVPIIIPQKNYGRFDRGLFNYIFIPKGKWGFGITASYGELNTEDIQVLSVLKDLDFSGKMYSVKPYLSYFLASNQSIGLRFNYTRGIADLGHLSVNFSDDLDFSIRDVSYYQQSFSVSTFYRNYVGLDRGGRFGVFNEVDLSFGTGSSRFKRIYNDAPRDTRTLISKGALNFSPGVCVFIQDFAAFNVSFGVFGINWQKEKQTTDGVDEGSRVTSGANFRFNIFNINFGLMVVI